MFPVTPIHAPETSAPDSTCGGQCCLRRGKPGFGSHLEIPYWTHRATEKTRYLFKPKLIMAEHISVLIFRVQQQFYPGFDGEKLLQYIGVPREQEPDIELLCI